MERLVVNKTIKKAYLELQKRVSSSYVRKGVFMPWRTIRAAQLVLDATKNSWKLIFLPTM